MKKKVYSRLLWQAGAILLVGTGVAKGNQVPQLTLRQMVDRADIVVIGRALDLSNISDGAETYAPIETVKSLKGEAPAKFQVLIKGLVAERNVSCCQKNARYILFLTKTRAGRYMPLNGRSGIIAID